MVLRFRVVAWLTGVVLTAGIRASYAQGFDYQFNADGVLPSAQLALFVGENVPSEAAVFSVSGGYLRQNTVPFPANAAAWYEFHNLFDHSIDAQLEFRAQLGQCTPPQPGPCANGAAVLVADDGYAWLFNLTPEGVYVTTPTGAYVPLVPLGTPAYPAYSPFNEHTYTVVIPANTSVYSMLIDGIPVATGEAYSRPGASYAWFGDGSPTGGNASIDWNYVRLTNQRVTYQICALYDETRAVRSGAAYPIKIQLCNASGGNLSSPDITVTALSTFHVSSNTTGEVMDTGNANPDGNFRYDADLAGYIFNLSTTGLVSGTYQLNLKAGSDTQTHSVQFQVK